jgi:putative flippase GtrA
MTPPPASILSEPAPAADIRVENPLAPRPSWDFAQLVKFVRFAIVGGLASIVYLALFATMVTAGVHYLLAGVVGYLAAIATNFAVNRQWTFGRGLRALHVQALSFLGVQLIIGAVNLSLLHVLVVSGVRPIILAQLLAAATLVPVNFVASQRWGFR